MLRSSTYSTGLLLQSACKLSPALLLQRAPGGVSDHPSSPCTSLWAATYKAGQARGAKRRQGRGGPRAAGRRPPEWMQFWQRPPGQQQSTGAWQVGRGRSLTHPWRPMGEGEGGFYWPTCRWGVVQETLGGPVTQPMPKRRVQVEQDWGGADWSCARQPVFFYPWQRAWGMGVRWDGPQKCQALSRGCYSMHTAIKTREECTHACTLC